MNNAQKLSQGSYIENKQNHNLQQFKGACCQGKCRLQLTPSFPHHTLITLLELLKSGISNCPVNCPPYIVSKELPWSCLNMGQTLLEGEAKFSTAPPLLTAGWACPFPHANRSTQQRLVLLQQIPKKLKFYTVRIRLRQKFWPENGILLPF